VTFALLAGVVAGTALAADAAPIPGTTTIYRWVDAQGVVHYTDSPQPGAQQLQVAPAQTYRAPPVEGPSGPDAAGPSVPDYQACQIEQPAAEQSFYAPDQVAVNVQLVPPLRGGDRLAVTVDGKQLQPADDSGLNFAVTEPDRGAHSVTAVVRDPNGRAACRAQPVSFYVRRPSLLSPQSPARGDLGQSAPGSANQPAGEPPAPAPPPAPPSQPAPPAQQPRVR
jgi:hypothetical protein